MKVTAIILAGGKSSRFGQDKSLLMWKNQLLMERLVDLCRNFAEEILIVSNQENKFGIEGTKEISDIYPNMGPLGGLHAGLKSATYERIFLMGCDMPMADCSFARKLLLKLNDYEAAVPCRDGYFHPVFTAFRRTPALIISDKMLKQGKCKVLTLLEMLRTYYWECSDEEERTLYNVNYSEDYIRLMVDECSE